MAQLRFRKPFARHNHARNRKYDPAIMGGGIMPLVVPVLTQQYWGGLWMPNTVPFLTTEEVTRAYHVDLRECTPKEHSSFVHITPGYLQDGMDPELIKRMFELKLWCAMKAMPQGATTGSHGGIAVWYKLSPQLAMMESIGMPLLLHPECNHNWIWDRIEKPQDREKRFIYEIVGWIRTMFPKLIVCLEHISSKESALAIKKYGCEYFVGTFTPQHIMQSFPMFYEKGMTWIEHMHPGYKDWDDWEIVRDVVAGGCKHLGCGEDGAPHFHDKKIDCLGCPGGFYTTKGVALYLQLFEALGALKHAENYLSVNTLHIYGLKPSDEYVTYSNDNEPDTVDDALRVGADHVHPWGYHKDPKKRHKFTWKQAATAA